MTVEELAKMLRVDERSVYRKAARNEIPGVFRVGNNGTIRFIKASILQWIFDQANYVKNV
jgi:excisionase family DNA binding protein